MYRWRLLATVFLCSSAMAAEDPAAAILDSVRSYVPAEYKHRKAPAYPQVELSNGGEGWVHMTYCVDENGTPQNISVAESAGSIRFERAAIKALQSWTFEPATVNGEPVWQSGNGVYVTFVIDTGSDPAASRRFAAQFNRFIKMLDEGRLADADKLFWNLLRDDKRNIYEISKLWSLRARHEVLAGDLLKADHALRRAIANDGKFIENEDYVELLGFLIKVSVKLAKFAEAIEAFETLEEKAGQDHETVQQLQPVMEQVRTAVASEGILLTPAEIREKGGCYGCDDSFMFKLARRDFALDEIKGQLSSITLRCNLKHFESAISDDVEWHIPESWGSCWLHVAGEPGTTFDIVQLAESS